MAAAADEDRCQSIRWKGLYLDLESDPADRVYWCQETQQCLGPDGKVVDHYECNETRPCYKEL